MMDDLLQEMVNPAPARADKARRRRLWASGTIVALTVVGATSLTTSALFLDNESTTNAITTGNVNLTVGSGDFGAAAADDSLDFTVPVNNLVPGATVVAPLTVRNAGSLKFQYGISYGIANDAVGLASQLRLSIVPTADVASCTAAAVGALGAPIGTTGPAFGLTSPASTPIVGQFTGAALDDSPTNRTLGAGASESLCVRVDFNDLADNEYADRTLDLTLRLDARQMTFSPTNPGASGS